MSESPVVVIPAPIGIMDWNYDVEREILEQQGVRLIVPDTAEEARAAMPDADVIFTSSPLTADDIATFRNAVGILCYSVGMDYVDAAAAAAQGIPIWNCPTSNNEEVSDHAVLLILAAQRRLLPLAMAAARGRLGRSTSGRSSARSTGCDADRRDHRARADRAHRGPQAAGFRLTVIAYDPYIEGTPRPGGRAGLARRTRGACGHRRVVRGADRHVARDDRRRDDLPKMKPGVLS